MKNQFSDRKNIEKAYFLLGFDHLTRAGKKRKYIGIEKSSYQGKYQQQHQSSLL